MSLLNFLKTGNVEEVSVAAKASAGVRKQRNPNPAIIAIRVFKDGSVFPSQGAVDKFDLEYKRARIEKVDVTKDGAEEKSYRNDYKFDNGQGNGFDVIDTEEWGQYKGEGRMLFLAAVPKGSGKVDLFGSVNYDAEGNPKANVLDQGAQTFGKEVLIPMLKAVYGIEFSEEKDFVDLEIVEQLGDVNVTEKFSKPILLVPKRITRGSDKGKLDYSRRENCKVFLLAPSEMLHGAEAEGDVPAEGEIPQNVEAVDMTESSVSERNAHLQIDKEA